MLSNEEFTTISLETNLFFQRIMKEHLYFIETNLYLVESDLIKQANGYRKEFDNLLSETIFYSFQRFSKDTLNSQEFVTPFTLRAEQVNESLTGVSINTDITIAEYELFLNSTCKNLNLDHVIEKINDKSYSLVKKVIDFQKKLISLSSTCKIFVTLYDDMLKHDTHEAEYYMEILKHLRNKTLPTKTLCDELNFWNTIMEEHSEYIDGMLDPTEVALKDKARDFTNRYEFLVKNCLNLAENKLIYDSQNNTSNLITYKEDATEGILDCQISSIIPPLLADHVLREANHYMRLLKILR